MRLALISDVHANRQALSATLDDIAAQAVDRVVCLGDIVGYNANPAECLALIRRNDVLCVAGNHDLAACGRVTTQGFSRAAARAVDWTRRHLTSDELDFLRALPLTANIGDQVIAVHGALHDETGCASVRLDNDESRMLSLRALIAHPSGARICAFGHTHAAAVYEYRGGEVILRRGTEIRLRDDAYYLINPGTVGAPRSKERRASYMVLDLQARAVTQRHVDYDAQLPFLAARDAGLVPRFGFTRLKQTFRELIKTT